MTSSTDPYSTTDPYEPREPDASLPELISRLISQSSTLFREELQLAKTELRQEIRKAGRAGGMFGAAAATGFLAVLLLSFAAAWGLGDLTEQPWLGFLIVGVIWAIVAGVLAMQGKSAADEVDPSLPETTKSVKEDVQWAKNQPR
jgi:hypothetical protein